MIICDGKPVTVRDLYQIARHSVTRDSRRYRAMRVPRFKGIVSAARKLGMSRIHLYLILTGRRSSPRMAEIRQIMPNIDLPFTNAESVMTHQVRNHTLNNHNQENT